MEIFTSFYFVAVAGAFCIAAFAALGLILFGVDLLVTWIYQYWT